MTSGSSGSSAQEVTKSTAPMVYTAEASPAVAAMSLAQGTGRLPPMACSWREADQDLETLQERDQK